LALLAFLISAGISYVFVTQSNAGLGSQEVKDLPDHPPNFAKSSPEEVRFRVLKPNHSQWFDGHRVEIQATKVNINSDGFRDQEYSTSEPNDTQRIIALGDSVTFGWGVNQSDTWPKQLKQKLNNGSETKVQILNFGVWGYNTTEEVEMLEEKGLDYSPDKVILQYHRNDAINKTRIKELKKDYAPEIREKYSDQNISEDRIRNKINKFIYSKEASERSMKPPKKSMADVRKSLGNLNRLSERNGFSVYIFGWPVDNRRSEYLSKVSDRYNFTYIETQEVLQGKYDIKTRTSEYKVQDGHPNARGHSIITEQVFEPVNSTIK